ncbi:MAG TPA: DnaJ domain-containing protein [Thermoanaerobaculia bacterium]|nr:DnaJ domain-containing protein [Thermoanaerobaculia bacterium]
MPRELDYYGLLGVARDASEAEIRERFRTLAREAHPDRAPAAKKAEAEGKFQDLTEAVNVLTSAERRKAYDFDLAAAAGMSEDADMVAHNYLGQGIAAYKDRKFAEAAGNFQLAVGRNPRDVKAQHYLGLASARAGDVRAAVKAIESALSIEPHNGALLKDAGAIFRQAGLLLKAEKAYQEAIRWDPAAAEARKALEEIRVQRAGRG